MIQLVLPGREVRILRTAQLQRRVHVDSVFRYRVEQIVGLEQGTVPNSHTAALELVDQQQRRAQRSVHVRVPIYLELPLDHPLEMTSNGVVSTDPSSENDAPPGRRLPTEQRVHDVGREPVTQPVADLLE